MDRNPHEVHRVEHDPERADGALQHRRVRDVEDESLFLEHAGSALRLGDALFGQIDVGPSGKAVFLVPGALAVPQKNELWHGFYFR